MLVALAGTTWAAAPRAVIEPSEYDLGTLVKGDVGLATFEIRNEGDAPLVIRGSHTGCDCTVVDYDRTIPPGGHGTLQATVDTAELRGDAGRGITVYTNDPARPKIFLVVRSIVLSSVEVLPDGPVELTNRPGMPSRPYALVRQVPLETRTMELHDIATSVPWLRVRADPLEERRPAGDGLPVGLPGDWLIQVEVIGDPDYGRSTPTVRMATGLDLEPEIELPVDVDFAPPVTLSEERVDLAPGGARTVLVAVRKDLDAARLTVDSEPAALRVERDRSDPRRFKLRLSWSGEPSGDGAVIFEVEGEHYRLPVVLTR